MYTVIYFPKDAPVGSKDGHHLAFAGDYTNTFNRHAVNERPSYSVRLWVFEDPDRGSSFGTKGEMPRE
jgi:hypothetical protein